MDPAEEIVNTWLQQKHFFVMDHVKVGYQGKEIDFLAINPKIDQRVHVEVRVAVIPVGPFRPWGPVKYGKLPLEQRVRLYFENKFVGVVNKKDLRLKNRCVEDKAVSLLGTDEYERWLVLGVLNEKTDSKKKLKQEFKKHRVRVFFIEDILKEIHFEGTARNSTGRFLQLLANQLTEESKRSLLNIEKVKAKPET